MAWKGVITNDGNDLLEQWTSGATIAIVSAASGTGLVDEAAMMAQSALRSQMQVASIISYEEVAEGKKVKLQIPAADVAYTLNQFGVWASLDGDDSKMLALFQNSDGIDVPSIADSPDFLYTFYGVLAFSNTGTLTVNVDTSAVVSLSTMNSAIAAAAALKQDKIVASGLLKGDGAGNIVVATAGEDFGLPLATGHGAPTEETVGVEGQHYYDSDSGKEYVCNGVDEDDGYIWVLSGASDADDLTYNGQPLSDVLSSLEGSKTLTGSTDPDSSTVGQVGQQYLNTESGQVFICTAADEDAGIYTWGESGGGGVKPQIVVTVSVGATVTCTSGETVLTRESEDGTCSFDLPEYGDWTLVATLDGETSSEETITVDMVKQYTVGLYFSKVYGVMWTFSSTSTALTRMTEANDPNALVNTSVTAEPSPAVGTGNGSSPFDSLLPWSGMEEYNVVNGAVTLKKGDDGFSRSGNDTVVFIPEFYFKIVNDAASSKRYFYISDHPKDGFEKHPGSGRYVGRYNTISGYYSKSGAAPLVSMTRAAARSGSKAKGSKWGQYDFASWNAVWLLYLVEYADWNSQSCIGRGWSDGNSAAINTGGTDSMVYHTGRAAGTDGKTAVQYRWIENPWGNVWEFVDGINVNERRVYVCLDPENFADDTATNYTDTGATLPEASGNYISALAYSEAAPWAFIPTAVGGSETTYIADGHWSNTGWRIFIAGGDWNDGSFDGLFAFNSSNPSSHSSAYIGARLLYYP